MRTQLLIVYGDGTKAMPLARITDRGILWLVARAAITEKREQAERCRRFHPDLGLVAEAESTRLETVLESLIPGLSTATPATV